MCEGKATPSAGPPPGDAAVTEFSAEPLPDVVRGGSDWRLYRALLLPNGITCVLVNDGESKTTAASVCVNSGASSDPRELSGLAHFAEHMCFLGSERYPGENEYKRYLSCHGGRSNASTSMSCTVFKFDVIAEHAEKAVDIFSEFFVSPLFTESGTSREVNAVDSENSKNLTADSRRRLQVLKALADPSHHWSKFSTGDARTLPAASSSSDPSPSSGDATEDDEEEADEKKSDADDATTTAGGGRRTDEAKRMREALLAFHRRHYRPTNMTVTIVGPQSLDVLEGWAVPRFSAVADRWSERLESGDLTEVERLIDEAAKDAPPGCFGEPMPPYNPAFRPDLQGGKWPVLLTTLPLRSVRKLVLMFPLPSVRKIPDQSPVSVLSHLLGHEGPGSSFAVLQDAGLLSSLSAGSRISGSDQCLLQISVSLTEEGEKRWRDVTGVIFEHCRLIAGTAAAAAKGIGENGGGENPALEELRGFWEEMAKINSMNFHQTSPSQAYDFAPGLAQSVAINGTEKCLSAGSLLDETGDTLPLDGLVDFSSRLVPTNCIIERCSQAAWDEQRDIADEESSGGGGSGQFGLKKERWYGVEYYLTEIDSADVAAWEGGPSEPKGGEEPPIAPVRLPRPNRFLPRSLDLCPELPEEARLGPRIERDIEPPNLVVDGECGRLWHRLDDRYALPKARLILLLRNAAVENSLDPDTGSWSYDRDAAMRSHLLTGAFSDALAQDTYDADLAGLHWSLGKSSSGITLSCGGYSDRLSDLALKLLGDFLLPSGVGGSSSGDDGDGDGSSESFLRGSHFAAVKDRTVRGLKSYFQSHRADSHAMYYRDLLLSSRGVEVEGSLESAEAATLESVAGQLDRVLRNCAGFECLYSGNVSEGEAKAFFGRANEILLGATGGRLVSNGTSASSGSRNGMADSWTPGPFERRLRPGEDVEIHFASKNPEEQNGAVLVTYQSQVPGFKGESLSTPESLRHSAAVRVLCHMMREPLFDELRTKRQLGYVVSGYHDISFSTREPEWGDGRSETFSPCTTPIDFIVVNVLSRKAPPREVALRIDEFMSTFRDTLATMPESEIRDHGDALSEKLLKPIRKLTTETGAHFGKIRRYASEVLSAGGGEKDLPWDSVRALARSVRSLERGDLLTVWDSVVTNRASRSRVVSFVYGNTFPLEPGIGPLGGSSTSGMGGSRPVVLKSLDELFEKRGELLPYDPEKRYKEQSFVRGILGKLGGRKTVGIAAVTLIGIGGAIGLSMLSSGEKEKGAKK